tara:strand:- start:1314 stop:3209 length:1896 start_codon:yes stop_codon:yes gene_type:complete
VIEGSSPFHGTHFNILSRKDPMLNFFKFVLIISIYVLSSWIKAECSDLNQTDCEYWNLYCQWDAENEQCVDLGGGGGGGDSDYGPYEFDSFQQSDGMQVGSLYADVTIYYPIDADLPYSIIILGAGWSGGQSSMNDWAYFFASYGVVAATIQYNDPDNDSHQYRSEAILELIESIKLEQTRNGSPVNGQLDTTSFSALGYSLSGGVVQLSAVLDSTLDAVIAVNPTIIVEDCDLCTGSDYCICLVPEFLDHSVPTLIISGENEVDELPSYDGMLGSDHYQNTPNTTTKMLYEIANGGHGSAAYPSSTNGEAGKFALNWIRYFLLGKETYCDSLLVTPDNASQFLTTLQCGPAPDWDCTASNNTEGVELWGDCYSISGTTELDLSASSLEGPISDKIGQLVNLTLINLRYNQLTGSIPASIGNLSNLNLLSLSNNQLSGVIPNEIGNLENLETLYLYDNQLSGEIPSSLFDLQNLQMLGLFDNELSGMISENICNIFSGLLYFSVEGNSLCAPYPSCIADVVGEQDISNCSPVMEIDQNVPDKFSIDAYPNPFNPTTTIAYNLMKNASVKIDIYNLKGRHIKMLSNSWKNAGYNSIQWNATNDRGQQVPSGLYIYVLQVDKEIYRNKLLLIK